MDMDGDLLRRYAESGSEEAFAELVRRHLNLVFSAALRQVNGDAQLAQDVAQTVFTDLARKAAALSRRQLLAGWLYTSTRFAAAKARRHASRRRTHELEAHSMNELLQTHASDLDWEKLGPVLDEVMHELTDSDRELLLMRFFESRRLAEIGEMLGLSEDAARKRVERALDKLRGFLHRRGVTATAALATLLSAQAVQMAPAGVAATLTSTALASAALAAQGSFTILKIMAVTKLKTSIVTAVIIAGVALPLALQQRARVRLQEENAALRQQLSQLQEDKDELSDQTTRARSAQLISDAQLRELLRLRGEAGKLHQQVKQLDALRADNQRLRAAGGAAAGTSLLPTVSNLAPFQIRLVVDDPDDSAETITSGTRAADGQGTPETLHVQKTPLLDATAIQLASAVTDASSGAAHIEILLTDQGREMFAKTTKANLNKRLAMVMDGKSYFAPVIREEITGGKIQITGSFTEEEAREFASRINQAVTGQ